jgi:hypothetical protein
MGSLQFPLFALLAGMSVAQAAAVAQAHPDFLGRWLLVGASGSTEALAQAITVQSTAVVIGTGGRACGAGFAGLAVSREIDGVLRTETLAVGLQGGAVGGVAPPQTSGSQGSVNNFWSVRWVDDCLVSYAETSAASADGSHSRTEQWCMNAAHQLVVTVRGASAGHPSGAAIRVYKRQQ